MRLIGITGGIGAGKSVVSRILRLQGYEVYDCDTEARRIMETDIAIREAVVGRYGAECVLENGAFDRKHIASRVFVDAVERAWLNSLIHAAVRQDIERWEKRGDVAFVESAILKSSGLTEMCDEIWLVVADYKLRITRAMQRGGINIEDLRARMAAQENEFAFGSGIRVHEIDNNGNRSLLDQIHSLLKLIKNN